MANRSSFRPAAQEGSRRHVPDDRAVNKQLHEAGRLGHGLSGSH
jgi:hypothetical protein